MLSREQHSHPHGEQGLCLPGERWAPPQLLGTAQAGHTSRGCSPDLPCGTRDCHHLNKAQEQQEEFQDSQQGDQIGKLSCQAKDNPGEVKVL